MPSRVSDGPPPVTPRPDAGLGLLETLVSIVIVSTALLSIAATSAHVGAGLNATHERTRTLKVAQQQMETLLATSYDQVVSGSAVSEGVSQEWTVTETGRAKEIVLAYRYSLRGKSREGRLAGALLKP